MFFMISYLVLLVLFVGKGPGLGFDFFVLLPALSLVDFSSLAWLTHLGSRLDRLDRLNRRIFCFANSCFCSLFFIVENMMKLDGLNWLILFDLFKNLLSFVAG